MREDSPRWEQINPSSHLHEQDGLRELASYLPDTDPYHVWANVEFVAGDGSINEVDALVLTPSGLYVLELKHWQGELHGDGSQWVRRAPNSRLIPEDNPYVLANRKAKRLASLIGHYAQRQSRSPSPPYVGAAVFLHARALRAALDAIGRQHVFGLHDHPGSGLPSMRDMLLALPRNPSHRIDVARARQIVDLVKGAKIRPSVADRKVGQLLIHPRPFAEGRGWQDFLAGHVLDTALVRRVRFYLTSRAAEEDIPAIRTAAEREFRLLQGIHHPGIAGAHDLVEHPWGPAVVFDHERDWVRLDQWLVQRGDRLSVAQRLHLIGDLAEIMDYAHSRRLAHRALHPGAVYVCDPEASRPRLVVTNWQTGGRLSDTRLTRSGVPTDPASLELFYDDDVRRYQAPEVATAQRPAGHQLDVFSLGAIAYRIFADDAPAGSPEELASGVRDSGVNLAAAVDGMPVALVDAVYDATRGDPAVRLASVAAFRAGLEQVWEELTAPEPEPVVDPLTARKGDALDVGLTVVSRLGAGATAVALLVSTSAEEGEEPRHLVLKVARDEQHRNRLIAEARTMQKLRHPQVVALVEDPIVVGGRTSLLMESAGERSLAEELHDGRLAIDLLERYGRDLLEIVSYLDGQGVWHRDVKPANLAARPRPKDKQPHLCVFDFSLAATPADQITAGTTGYLDPFLGAAHRRPRYDAAAERFAAAVTLFEMATGTLPQWGGAHPSSVSGEVTLDPAMFDSAVADRLVDFFGQALAREAGRRFHTADEMTDAWRAIFRQVPGPGVVRSGPLSATGLTLDSALDDTELTDRARSALQRLGLHRVRDLLEAPPSTLTRARGVPDATRKEILAQARALRDTLSTPQSGPAEDELTRALGIEALCALLLPVETPRNRTARTTLAVLLGQSPGTGGALLRWPTQSEVARLTGQTQPQVSVLLRKQLTPWRDNQPLSVLRDEIAALVEARGAVMSAVEVAEALVATHGSYTAEPKRSTQAIGLVRAAVETELSLGGDARLAIQRFRGSDTVLIGREPNDPTAETTAADLLGYVVSLGDRAAVLAGADPLPSRQRATEDLRSVAAPIGMPALADLRLLQLAAAGSNGRAEVNAQGQLYPRAMPAERALRLAAGSLIGHKLTPDEVRGRVRARFPHAQGLPDRPALSNLLRDCRIPLTWHPTDRRYVPPAVPSLLTGTRTGTTLGGSLVGVTDADEVTTKLASVVERRVFLAVLTPLRHLAETRRALLGRLDLIEVDVTALLLEGLRGLGYPWEAIMTADTGSPLDADFRSLTELVQHQVVPTIHAALNTDRPVLLTEAAPLIRYGQLRLLQELADPTRLRPAARLLLVAARKPEPPLLDGVQLPLTSPAAQSLWVSGTWLAATSGRTVHHGYS